MQITKFEKKKIKDETYFISRDNDFFFDFISFMRNKIILNHKTSFKIQPKINRHFILKKKKKTENSYKTIKHNTLERNFHIQIFAKRYKKSSVICPYVPSWVQDQLSIRIQTRKLSKLKNIQTDNTFQIWRTFRISKRSNTFKFEETFKNEKIFRREPPDKK